MGMSIGELREAIQNIAEGQISKLKAEEWAQVELARIINRKHYWWRQKALSFDSVAGTGTYNLGTAGTAPLEKADDFVQMATPLYRWISDDNIEELPFEGRKSEILRLVYSSKQDKPTVFTVEPGTTKTIRLGPIPNAVHTYRGLYWAGLNIYWKTQASAEIPLIPPEYHYVPLASLQRRAFFYLYGQKDPRFAAAVQEELAALADLDAYKAPSTLHVVELRSSDQSAFVRSTS